MTESIPVRCPGCRREHRYTAPAYPCACGAPVSPPLDPLGAATAVTHRTWDEDWIAVRCQACDREDQWPQPELGCPCGILVRVPVTVASQPLRARERCDPGPFDRPDLFGPPAGTDPASGPTAGHPDPSAGCPGTDDRSDRATALPRPAFHPVTIRTARDAVTAAALYLRWLGYRDIRRAAQRPPSGIGLAARGVVAQVDPTVRPASPRDVECLWLTAMTESAGCVYFSLAGYDPEARDRADHLGIALFVLDLTGTPQPVNGPANELISSGA
ncbi:hypothetical protein GCM10010145_14020 [Streptomyces ruber]|uniref:Restriction endonuclease n=2 Tax=Streptomyces TaxID=1883 RepID=A0A918EQ20_9ACTN|nr:hypothetical protein [Streptomyces ruber]GGQ46477.1 hypothetical protein GCM10010145_14020 [Streptomyces ruber]